MLRCRWKEGKTIETTLTIDDIERPSVGQSSDLLVVYRQAPQTDAARPDAVTSRFEPTSHALLASYADFFDQVFIPYNGPDEAPKFEPEDYPVR